MIRAPSVGMSDAAAEKTDKEPAAAGGGNKKILIIVMIVNVLLVGGLAYVVISSRNQAAAAAAAALKQAHPAKHAEGEDGEEADAEGDGEKGKEEAEEGEGEKKDAKHGKFGPLLEIGTFVANLQGNNPGEPGRYAKVTLHAEAINEEAKARVEAGLVPIKSEALMLLSNAKPEDIIGADKIKKMADEMVKRANKVLGKKSIKNIYFAELVVQ